MATPPRRPGDPYQVGFARPPKATRFQKGRSGNNRGRPRKTPTFASEVAACLDEKVTLVVEGRRTQVTAQKALLLTLHRMAVEAKPGAEKLLLKLQRSTPPPPEPPAPEVSLEEIFADVARMVGHLKASS
jgi:hypothetical protein